MAQKKQKADKRYSGVLSRPIKFDPDLLLKNGPSPDATSLDGLTFEERCEDFRRRFEVAEEKLFEANSERIAALFKHYAINPLSADADRQLWVALAKAHVPGFKISKPQQRGAKTKWTIEKQAALFHVAYDLINLGNSELKSCAIIAKKEIEKQNPSAARSEINRLTKQRTKTIHRRWMELKTQPLFSNLLSLEKDTEQHRALSDLLAYLVSNRSLKSD